MGPEKISTLWSRCGGVFTFEDYQSITGCHHLPSAKCGSGENGLSFNPPPPWVVKSHCKWLGRDRPIDQLCVCHENGKCPQICPCSCSPAGKVVPRDVHIPRTPCLLVLRHFLSWPPRWRTYPVPTHPATSAKTTVCDNCKEDSTWIHRAPDIRTSSTLLEDGVYSFDRCDSNQCSAPLRLFLALGRALNFMALLTGVTQTSALPLSACSLPLDTLSTSLALLTGVTQTSALPLSACSLPLDALSTSWLY